MSTDAESPSVVRMNSATMRAYSTASSTTMIRSPRDAIRCRGLFSRRRRAAHLSRIDKSGKGRASRLMASKKICDSASKAPQQPGDSARRLLLERAAMERTELAGNVVAVLEIFGVYGTAIDRL